MSHSRTSWLDLVALLLERTGKPSPTHPNQHSGCTHCPTMPPGNSFPGGQLSSLYLTLLLEGVHSIMSFQDQAAEKLESVVAQLAKISGETNSLLTKIDELKTANTTQQGAIAELQAAIAELSQPSARLTAALDGVVSGAAAVDALVEDLPSPEVPVEPEPEVPGEPEPETPVDPEVPGEPEPEEPVEPEQPVDPEVPTEPEVPVDPEQPEVPGEPGEPQPPVDPATQLPHPQYWER